MDEPTSLLALGMSSLLVIERGFARWMTYRESKRSSTDPPESTSITWRGERGSAGNGPRATAQRLDALDARLKEMSQEIGRIRTKLQDVDALAQRLDERTSQK